jgi:predicted alpha/beta superfamily hydrolase
MKYIISLVSLFFLHIQSHAQQVDSLGSLVLDNIETYKFRSSIIGEDYTVYVLKTDGYDTSNGQLPVLYMTDGDWNMTVAMNCFRMLRQDYTTHEPLVVGIGYGTNENKRVRDLDPNGGGPKFLSFIEKELMPFIEKKYRTNKERAIYGYSMGGMFTTYILFNRPDLFQKIYIGAPGNNGNLLMPAAREYFSKNKDLKSKVFIGVGSFEKEVVKNIDSFTNYLASKKLRDFEISSAIAPNAGHGAALSQVMESAIAYGYCDKHKQVALNSELLKDVEGHYTYYENNDAVEELDVYMKDGKLYMKWKQEGSTPDELLYSGDGVYFVPINERQTYRFNPPNELILHVSNKDYKFVKKK